MRDILVGDRNGYTMIYTEQGRGLTLLDTLRRNNGQKIRVNNNSNPEVIDWDEDGKKDLIIGEETYVSPNTGNIRVYLNTGTNDNPTFNNYSLITAGGSQIYHYRVNPRVFDLDEDGLKDLIVGENYGMLYFYRNVGTNANPVFNAGYDTLRTESGAIIDAYYGSRFCFTDWKGDGDPDFLVSGYDGLIEYYENATIIGVEEQTAGHEATEISITPNPVRDRAYISYTLHTPGEIQIDAYSVDGRYVATVMRDFVNKGPHKYVWNVCDNAAQQLSAGVYFLNITTGTNTHTKRILVIH